MTPDPHDGWTPEPQEQVQPGDPWRDPTPDPTEARAALREAVTDLHRWDVSKGWGAFNTILGRIDDHLATLDAAREQAAADADLRLLAMTTARDAAVVEADNLRSAATEARRDLLAELRTWVGNEAMRQDKYPSGTTVVDAEELDRRLIEAASSPSTEEPSP